MNTASELNEQNHNNINEQGNPADCQIPGLESAIDKGKNPQLAFEEVRKLLTDAVKDGVFPGAVVFAGHKGSLIYQGAFGQRNHRLFSAGGMDAAPMQLDSVFDVAGLTSAVVTTSLIMKLVEQGRIKLDERVSRYLQGFGVNGKSPVTITHLLTHTSGFPANHLFHEEIALAYPTAKLGMYASKSAKDFIVNSIARSGLKGEIGGKPVTSDLNFLVLGLLIESVLGISLDKAAYKYIIEPLKLKTSSFINLALLKHSNLHPVTEIIAPTEECSWRQKLIWGEVQDDNSWTMGGVAGHAGLFSTASDMFAFSAELLAAVNKSGRIFPHSTIETFIKNETLSGNKLGFDSPTKENGMIDSGLSSRAFGVNGFTGCSLWVDPASQLNIVIMCNRVHPSRNNKKINILRPILVKSLLDAVRKVIE